MPASIFRFPINAVLSDSSPYGFLDFRKDDDTYLTKVNTRESRRIRPALVADLNPQIKFNRVLDLRAIRREVLTNEDARYLVVNVSPTKEVQLSID